VKDYRNIIEKSGYNIYQLAKEAGLDRTTLQKTVKGQRLPSFEFISKICSYIKINCEQEEEIYRLYQMEKVGKAAVEMWDEISALLENTGLERNRLCIHRLMEIRFDDNAFIDFNREEIQVLSNELDIMKATICLIEEEIEEQDNPEIYMDDSRCGGYALSQLVQAGTGKKKKVVLHQLIKLKNTDASQKTEDELTNIKMLRNILPFAFAFQDKYDVRYSYVSGNEEDNRYYLWPHYIITHRHILLCAEERDEVMLISNQEMAYCYSMRVKKMLSSYRPFLEYELFTGKGISVFNNHVRQSADHIVFEMTPNLIFFLPEEQKELLPVMMDLTACEQILSDIQQPEETIYFFGLNGLKYFMSTGNWHGIPEIYFHVETLGQRKRFVEAFHQHLLKKTKSFGCSNTKTQAMALE
jgi:DNA-binding XRE family transcriptional regulator